MSAVLGQGYQVAAESAESVPLANHEVITLVVSMMKEREREREMMYYLKICCTVIYSAGETCRNRF